MKQNAICSLSLSSPTAASVVHPTPLATFYRVPYGVVLLLVLALYDDLDLAAAAILQVTLVEKRPHNCGMVLQ